MKIGWRGALGFGLSAAFLVWTLHDVPFAQVWQVLRASSVPLFLISTAVATLVFPMRAMRWRVILGPAAEGVPFGSLWRATAIGMMVNNVIPARAGEIARGYVLAKEEPKVTFATAFASLAVDRIFDGVVVVLLLVVAMFVSDFPLGTTIGGQPINRVAIGAGIIAGGALAALFALALFPQLVRAIWNGVVGRIAPNFVERGQKLLDSFMAGLGALRSPGRFALVFAWAVAMWLVNALSFGVFEFFAVEGLALYGVPKDLAVSWALGYHLLSFIPITLIGLYYFGRMGLRFGDLGEATRQKSRAPAAATE
jgi:uncharacterized membrane protein YbhN (UPF0104 family)